MDAFLSYQTSDKAIAGKIKEALEGLGVTAFLAHEDIQVSEQWRTVLLRELSTADLFIAVLSKHYFQSVWCAQESGIAAFRDKVCIIPLSVDGTVPQGFISHIQSVKIDPSNITWPDLVASLLPGLVSQDFDFVFDKLTELVRNSRSFRGSEAIFKLIHPYLGRASDQQKALLLKVSVDNDQVLDASLCAQQYLPPLMATHGHTLSAELRAAANAVLSRHAKARAS